MNFSDVFRTVSYQFQKHLPTILVGVGVTGVVAGTVVACKETRKVDIILSEHEQLMEDIQLKMAVNKAMKEEYTEKEKKKDTVRIYAKTGLKFVKLYSPAAAILGGSIACICGSHHILTKRNIALGAAYATVDAAFKEYRDAVAERFGEEVDKELRYSVKSKKVKDKETGEEKVTYEATEQFAERMIHDYSMYAKVFDETNPNWSDSAEYNMMFLKRVQQDCNDRLKARGYLYLNEVYERLGFDGDKKGQVVGWFYNKKAPIGDNFVDFGIYDIHNPAKRDFINGKEKAIILDFNVDGNIWELM